MTGYPGGDIGPFFELEPWRPGEGWRPLADLLRAPGVLAERVAVARAIIAERAGLVDDGVEARVAASIVFLGLAARLVSPPLAAVVTEGSLPTVTVADLWWRPVAGGPWPMAVSPVQDRSTGTSAEFVDTVVLGVVQPVLSAFASGMRVSRRVLWGNVGSALAGAVTMLSTARPRYEAMARDYARRVIELPPLRGTGTFDDAGLSFVRTSCCLFYRVPGAGTCGDCVLNRAGRLSR